MCTSSPAAASPWNASYFRLDVFVRGSDGAVWQKNWNDSKWSNWQSLGGQLTPNTGPAVSEDLYLFVQGTDHQLWHKSAGSVGGTWGTLSGKPPEALSTATPASVLPPAPTP
ncbi:MAG: hypothetical protein WCG09_01090 [Halobacteriota archaeon]